jgi:hypothetical protein
MSIQLQPNLHCPKVRTRACEPAIFSLGSAYPVYVLGSSLRPSIRLHVSGRGMHGLMLHRPPPLLLDPNSISCSYFLSCSARTTSVLPLALRSLARGRYDRQPAEENAIHTDQRSSGADVPPRYLREPCFEATARVRRRTDTRAFDQGLYPTPSPNGTARS